MICMEELTATIKRLQLLKDNTDSDNYDEYLETRRIEGIIKKYSDYVKYPIIMRVEETRLKDDAEYENDT